MIDSTTPRTRMTPHICAGSALSRPRSGGYGSPMQPAWASPCVLDQLDLRRPRAHAAAESTIQTWEDDHAARRRHSPRQRDAALARAHRAEGERGAAANRPEPVGGPEAPAPVGAHDRER